jgi:hypothetical protein
MIVTAGVLILIVAACAACAMGKDNEDEEWKL